MPGKLLLPVAYPDCGTPPDACATFKIGLTRLPDRTVQFGEQIIDWQKSNGVYSYGYDSDTVILRERLALSQMPGDWVLLDYKGYFSEDGNERIAQVEIALKKDCESLFSDCTEIVVLRYVVCNQTEARRKRKRRIFFSAAVVLLTIGIMTTLWRSA